MQTKEDQAQVAEHIGRHLIELQQTAKTAGLDMLAYLIDLATLEAFDVKERLKGDTSH